VCKDELVGLRGLRNAVLVVLMAFACGGCLKNTPTNVAKRFVNTIQYLKWDSMEKLVDWPSSERALGRKSAGNRRQILTEIAESISSYDIREYGEKRARSNFSFFRVSKVETLSKTEQSARLRIDLRLTNEKSKTFEMTTRKVGRTWRVVLTPNLLKGSYVDY